MVLLDLNRKLEHGQRRRGCLRRHKLRPAVTLTFDLQNIIRSSVGTDEYSLSALSEGVKE